MNKQKMLSYQSINYGDLGIGYAIYKAGVVFGHEGHLALGLEVLENASMFRDDTGRHIRDAEMIYGSTGLYAVFSILYEETKRPCFKQAYAYWLGRTLAYDGRRTPWAGFETYYNGFDNAIQVCFNHGISGIGIALINHQLGLGHDYLRFFNYKNL